MVLKHGTDLGVGKAHPTSPVPSFSKRNYTAGTVTSSAATTLDIFAPRTACTVQWILFQLSSPCTIQLLENGQPVGASISYPAFTIIQLPGRLLPNNAKLSLSVSAAVSISYEIAWVLEFDPNLIIVSDVSIFAGTNFKMTRVITTTPLASNGTFTSPWFDSNADGALYVICTYNLTITIPGGTNFVSIQESDDSSNASFTRTITLSGNGSGAGLGRIQASIKARYYRLVLTNGVTAQTTGFEVTLSSMNFLPSNFDGSSQGNITQFENIIFTSGTSAQAGESFSSINYLCDSTNTQRPLSVMPMVAIAAGSFFLTRTPATFAQASTAANGSTALVSPAAGIKFRLMRFKIQVTQDATLAAAGELTIKLLDAAIDIGLGHIVYIGASFAGYDSGWIDLGQYGYISTTAAAALNINLSAALTAGKVNVIFAGIVAAAA